MLNNSPKRLTTRLAKQLAIVATLLVLLSAWGIYERNLSSQKKYAHQHLVELIKTVSKTASIAAFVGDDLLAKEVISGLVNNTLISAAKLNSDEILLYSMGTFSTTQQDGDVHYSLMSPFDNNQHVGELVIQADQSVIEASSTARALEQVIYIFLVCLLMIIVIIFLFHSQIISTVKSIAAHLHKIQPGSKERLPIVPEHSQNELGMLINDINNLLHSVEAQLDQERTLRNEVENLEKRFRNIFEKTRGGLALINQHGHVQMHNPSFEKMVGPSLMARLSNSPKESIFSVFQLTDARLTNQFHKTISNDTPLSIDLNLKEYNHNKWIHCTISAIPQQSQSVYEVLIQDISARRLREETFKVQAELDPLTSLFNRRGGEQKAKELFDSMKGQEMQYAILMIDLDNFKPVNDEFGHETGDLVLISIVKRLQNITRDDDIIIRWGGDEFLIIIKESQNGTDAKKVAEKLLDALTQPIELDNQSSVTIGASIGIAIYPEHGIRLDSLALAADEAMYQVKANSKNNFSFYSK